MQKTSFEWNGATFVVSEDTVRSGVVSEFVAYQVFPRPSTIEFQLGVEYGTFLETVQVADGDPGFAVPSVEAPGEELRTFYETFSSLPRAFRNRWLNARIALTNGGNPDLAPGVEKKDNSTPATAASATRTSKK